MIKLIVSRGQKGFSNVTDLVHYYTGPAANNASRFGLEAAKELLSYDRGSIDDDRV